MSTQSLKPGWKMVKFGDVVKNANLVERNPEANDIERIVGLEHIDPENLHIRRWNSVGGGTSFTRKFVPGQTLFGKRRAYQRKVAYAEFEGICSGDILTFESKDKNVLLTELLPFICQSDAFFDHALGTSAGSLSPRTSWAALKDFEFPLPPLDEQKRIAEILWAADEAVEKNVSLKRSLLQYYQSSIETLCFNKQNQEFRIEELGGINNATLSVSKTDKNYRFNYLDIGSIIAPKIIGELIEYILADAPSRARRVVKSFDVLLSTVRPNLQSFVRIGEIDKDLIASTGFAVISPKDKVVGSIMFHSFFSKYFTNYCKARVTGTSYPAISSRDIGKFRIHVPNKKDEMQKIAIALDSIDYSISQVESNIESIAVLKKKLLEESIRKGVSHV
ncbi:restriction endonuclease subunit S [Prosthecochloris vibrioformis]|uniref:Restriction endonuclease subunit S n=1 Tax=Prosthecochloris vibrioformis TaxID=1098 RepID=A0A5C4RZR6_PROVB|nr:restriction endonuclease subunit S [Prosthecochloris vibrioformis]TNJ36746.1 restriction endonuclease subunit S [Prosthecochloris vibrioformis]